MKKNIVFLAASVVFFIAFVGMAALTVINVLDPNNLEALPKLTGGTIGTAVLTMIFILVFYKTKYSEFDKISKEVEEKDIELTEKRTELENKIKEIEGKQIINALVTTISDTIQKATQLEVVAPQILEKIAHELDLCQGVFYTRKNIEGTDHLVGVGTYAYHKKQSEIDTPEVGVGLVGQVAKENQPLFIDELPEGYIDIISGLGKSKPGFLAVLPLVYNNVVLGVLELASFKEFTSDNKELFKILESTIGTGIHFINQQILIDELQAKQNETEIVGSTQPTVETFTPPVVQEEVIEEEQKSFSEELQDEDAETTEELEQNDTSEADEPLEANNSEKEKDENEAAE